MAITGPAGEIATLSAATASAVLAAIQTALASSTTGLNAQELAKLYVLLKAVNVAASASAASTVTAGITAV